MGGTQFLTGGWMPNSLSPATMGSRLSSPYEVLGCSYTKPLTFHSLAPSDPSITWRVQWKLFSPNIKSYLGAFKTRQIYFCKRSLFACLRALHFIYRADINWCTGASKTVYIHSKIHFCDTHTTVSPEPRAPWTLLIPLPVWFLLLPSTSQTPATRSSWFFCLGSLRCLSMLLQAALEGETLGLKYSTGHHISDSLESLLLGLFLHSLFLVHVLSGIFYPENHLSKRLH